MGSLENRLRPSGASGNRQRRRLLYEGKPNVRGPRAEALIFPGVKGGPLRRSNFNKMAAWPHAVHAIGADGLHFHDLRHTGNHFAAASGASLKDLMARIGHDSERAAIIYQHDARGADLAISSAIDAHIETAKASQGQPGDRHATSAVPVR